MTNQKLGLIPDQSKAGHKLMTNQKLVLTPDQS
jgi:hypothetical protein